MNDAKYPKGFSSRLEAILTSYTGHSSRGILQGIYPSDLFGNYYLSAIDQFLAEYGVPSSRYVDDVYIFVPSVETTDHLIRELIPALRNYDLSLNEAKSVIIPKSALITEEPDLEKLFSNAVEEIASQLEEQDFDADYGFQSEWEDDVDDEKNTDHDELELKATQSLFDSISQYPGHEESIERFCLPLFWTAASDHALSHVLASFKKRPAMTQIYSSYVARFLDTPGIANFLVGLLSDSSLVDWQKMWILAALSQAEAASDVSVKAAYDVFKDATRHDALRAVAAIYVGRFGDHARRTMLISAYAAVSVYIQSAIYFSSKDWPSVERSNIKGWSNQSPVHKLIAIAMMKK